MASDNAEYFHSEEEFKQKIGQLKEILSLSKNIVVFTGAGISTAASIPDIRSPEGLDNKPKPMVVLGMQEKELEFKMPTFSHVALAELLHKGFIKTIITSNHDNLHVKGGVKPSEMVDLFGNVYVEKCGRCQTLFHRNCITPSLGRNCDIKDCGGRLMKTGTRMNAMTPEKPLQEATNYAKQADLALVLGSSMQVSPFCELPTYAKKMVICNLQKTPYNSRAEIVIHDRCDKIIREISSHFGISVNSFEYTVPFLLCTVKNPGGNSWKFRLTGIHPNEPCMCVEKVAVILADKKKYTLEQQSDLSFSSEISENGTEVTWEIEFKEQYNLPPFLREMKLDKENIEVTEYLRKLLIFDDH